MPFHATWARKIHNLDQRLKDKSPPKSLKMGVNLAEILGWAGSAAQIKAFPERNSAIFNSFM